VVADGRLTALCHVGANLVPSGRGVAALAKLASRGEPRMMVGEEGAVTELWKAYDDQYLMIEAYPAAGPTEPKLHCARNIFKGMRRSSRLVRKPANELSRGLI
jgi:hypothetical protein